MQNILEMLNSFQGYIILGMAAIIIILLILIVILFKSISNVEKRYRKFMRGSNNKNIEELVLGYLDKIDEVKKDSEDIREMYSDIDKRVRNCVQKISMMRYRAFEDVGSDLSFSVALLDDSNDGIILTGIYGRNESTTYAKPVDKGISRYDLSEEEEEVLNDAMSK